MLSFLDCFLPDCFLLLFDNKPESSVARLSFFQAKTSLKRRELGLQDLCRPLSLQNI